MALPLLTTGLKLFQSTRSKGSPQSTTQTTTVDGAVNLGAKMKAAPAGQRRSSTPSISISKFLPQSSAPQKDVKFKDRRYKPLGDVVNSITKSFASILSIFKADDKLSRRQADDQRQKNAAAVMARARTTSVTEPPEDILQPYCPREETGPEEYGNSLEFSNKKHVFDYFL